MSVEEKKRKISNSGLQSLKDQQCLFCSKKGVYNISKQSSILYLSSNKVIITKTPKSDSNSMKCCIKCYTEINTSTNTFNETLENSNFKTSPMKTRKIEEKKLLDKKYSFQDNDLLLNLLKKAQFECEKCEDILIYNGFTNYQNGIFGIKFSCQNSSCNHYIIHSNSKKLRDGSYELIRDLGISWFCAGFENQDLLKFSKIFDIGVQSKDTIQSHQSEYFPIINDVTLVELQSVIDKFNKSNEQKGIQMDVQWSTSQKQGRRAFSCCLTVIDDATHKVLLSICVDNDELKKKLPNGDIEFLNVDDDEKPIKCLEKLSILKMVETIPTLLEDLNIITIDKCGSATKWIKENLIPKFKELHLQYDLWHFLNGDIVKKWEKFISTTHLIESNEGEKKKFKFCKNCDPNKKNFYESRKQVCDKCKCKSLEAIELQMISAPMYPNLSKLSWSIIKNHFIYCSQNNEGYEDMYNKWTDFPTYLCDEKEIPLTEIEKLDLLDHILSKHWIDDLQHFIYGKRTSKTENYHSLMNIFIKKGKNYKFQQYQSRHNLCILHNSEIQDMKNNQIDDEKLDMQYHYIDKIKLAYFSMISKK